MLEAIEVNARLRISPDGSGGTGGALFSSSAIACALALVDSCVSEKCLNLNMLKRLIAGLGSCNGGESGGSSIGRRIEGHPYSLRGRGAVGRGSEASRNGILAGVSSPLRSSAVRRSKVLRRRDNSGIRTHIAPNVIPDAAQRRPLIGEVQ